MDGQLAQGIIADSFKISHKSEKARGSNAWKQQISSSLRRETQIKVFGHEAVVGASSDAVLTSRLATHLRMYHVR